MTVQALIRDLLHWIPAGDRTGALKDVLAARHESGDHESVRALSAVLREREAAPAASTTWAEEDGA